MPHKQPLALWWKRGLHLLGALTGVIASAATPSPAAAQGTAYRSAASAPATWQNFAGELKGSFENRLAGDAAAARRLHEALAKHDKHSSETLVVRSWVTSAGKIERLEFDGIDDVDIIVGLRALLASVVVSPPPADMLQPLHLHLSVRSSDQSHEE
ncbi:MULTISPECIES: hypothetical protein [Afipia]|uniref:YbaB/EbfC family nucleoid-associated protein n=1 Tax=Afipia massiliensis TaxID=211460 RepID=A0A840N046_9BRAD|nr:MULTISPECIES: hypothetical protein [Afipia]MBB5051847.1 hypothetical protein [Afipia massiliensis]